MIRKIIYFLSLFYCTQVLASAPFREATEERNSQKSSSVPRVILSFTPPATENTLIRQLRLIHNHTNAEKNRTAD